VHQQVREDSRLFTQFTITMLGFIAVIAGGVLGYYIHWTLFTLMLLGALTTVTTCWRATRV
jgi:ABC-type antimicrobial peptide transport system permease subunit